MDNGNEKWTHDDEKALLNSCLACVEPDRHSLVYEAFGQLEGIFTAAGRGRFRLLSVDEIDRQKAAAAIDLAWLPTPGLVTKVVPVSVARLNAETPSEEWLPEEERRRLSGDIAAARWNSLVFLRLGLPRQYGGGSWGMRYEDVRPIRDRLSKLEKCLADAIGDTLWPASACADQKSLASSIDITHWPASGTCAVHLNLLRASVCDQVSPFLRAAVTDQPEIVGRMTPLMRTIPECLPLAYRGTPEETMDKIVRTVSERLSLTSQCDEPQHVWIVLAA